MRLATWNINSVRLRIDLVMRLLDELSPDILCLQETKVADPLFPHRPFEDRGYVHRAINGMPGYNGVAIVSRMPFEDAGTQDWCGKEDSRHVWVRLAGGTELHNIYVPSGGDVPDPDANDKFAHKLDFVDAQAAWWTDTRGDGDRAILVGDLNIAPLENDVWSHKQMLSVVSHTPVEVEKLTAWQNSLNWVDVHRHYVPADQKLYSWWSYRARDWSTSDRGRRLDHIWVTPALQPGLRDAGILREARGWEPKPSDHVPAWADIEI